ncbi:MAG: protein kinase [Polyangiaceae bacterium]
MDPQAAGEAPSSSRTRQKAASSLRRPPPSVRLPNPQWTRYTNIEFVGTGGMGRVYKALDPKLNRVVALKFLRENEPAAVRRLLREAKAQASIDHPNICKVYEVGEVDGQSYIAMQYIEGRSLRAMRRELSLDAKVEIMRKVAEAMHAAHRLGVIHRDIKTANIMLESNDEGGFRPYLMDFGLAHVSDAPGNSRVGLVEGTPSYMSPEQAQGQTGKLDRRTDVYSMGACLYELLADRVPFAGSHVLDVIMKVIHEEPEPIRRQSPAVPEDLDIIVLKCLEKEPERRYDSAKALAEDLRRYLDGEPILARKASIGYRLSKLAKKNRALVVLGSVALAAMIAGSAFGVRLQVRAREQAKLAQQLGHDVEEIESFLRFAYTMPPHDIGPEKDVVRRKMAAIAKTTDAIGTIGQGPGKYALGRGHLVLHEYEEALKLLTAAGQAGETGPELEYATGLALGGLYHRELDEAQRIADKDARDARKKDIESKYLVPALDHIRKGAASAATSQAHADALIAFYEKRYGDAAKLAHEAAERSPWLYETRELEGEAYFILGSEKHDRGDDEGALKDLQSAAEAHHKAADIARSDGDIQEALAETWINIMIVRNARGMDSKPAFQSALGAADQALVIDGQSANAFSKKSRAHWLSGEWLFSAGSDPRPDYEKAILFGREAVRLNPRDAVTWDNIGNAAESMASYEVQRGLDPMKSYETAIEAYQRSLDENPAFAWAWNDMGVAEQLKADQLSRRGMDARPTLERSINLFKHAIDADPTYVYPYVNMGLSYSSLAQLEGESGKDPRPFAALGLDACRLGSERNKNNTASLVNGGHIHLVVAQYEMSIGLDPRAAIDQSIEANRRALEIKPAHVEAQQTITEALRLEGVYLLSKGEDITKLMERARAERDKLLEMDAGAAQSQMLSGQVDLLSAQVAIQKDADPDAAFLGSTTALARAAAANPLDPAIHDAAAELSCFLAEHQKKKKEPVDETIRLGLLRTDAALKINPHRARSLSLQGRLLVLRAGSQRNARSRAADVALALESFEKAVKENPLVEAEIRAARAEAQALETSK